ncbi:related to TLG2 - member of the syntaxin family of t-SNAREs [Ustilago trichophora]|uniref:Related to TLG2 - member of the syntaxin family of t-SNAREs n=1 Tax=Ustilago trichophora TaxID=86804 RepID=A0A5C3ELN5_9BASI|nr:related to TLG2 - member of the syntaxin family of t-SNAREs [Ustilago trichophora]
MAAHYPLGSSSTPPPYASGVSGPSSHLGQIRSRTLLFLSYRDSAGPSSRSRTRTTSAGGDVYFQAPYTDSLDDPLGSNSLNNNNGPLESDTEHLLPSRRSREGHIALSLDDSSTPSSQLPPKWMDVSDQVDQILSSIRPRMDRLSRLHEKHLRPGFADKSTEEKQIESLALEITKDFRRCSRLVAGLASFTQHLIREAKRNQSDVTVRQIALAQNVQTALATRVQDLSGAFRKQQSLYLKRMKGMEVRDRDIRAARGLAPPSSSAKGKEPESTPSSSSGAFRDSELAVREDIELSRASLASPNSTSTSNLLLFEEPSSTTSQNDREIQQRSQEIDQIAKSIQELAQLFGDLQTLVIDQGTMLDRIDYNVELMGRELKGAVEELETATRYQRRSGRRQCILFLCLLIAVLVAIIVIKPFWRFFASNSSSPQTREEDLEGSIRMF